MSDRKTVPTEASVDEVIESTTDERRREDARAALEAVDTAVLTELVERAWEANHRPG